MQTVLVIDDDVMVAEELGRVLTEGGYLPTVKTTSISGLNYAKLAHPSLIISGICLAGVSGYEVANELRNDLATEDIPVIFLTGLTDARDTLRGFRVGAAAVLHKPATAEDILEVIRQVKRGSPSEKAEDIYNVMLKPSGLTASAHISLILARGPALQSESVGLGNTNELVQLSLVERTQQVFNTIFDRKGAAISRLSYSLHATLLIIPPVFTNMIGLF